MIINFGDDSFKPREREKRAELIRRLFTSGASIAAHTEICMDAGAWTDAELRQRATRACREEVRAALGALTEDGLPFAGPTPIVIDGAPMWRQMDLWTEADFDYNWTAFRKRGAGNITVANRIAVECRARFGRGPKQMAIVENDEPEV